MLLVLWLIGGCGGGDVILMGSLGAWLGPSLTVVVFLGSAVAILVLSVGVMAVCLLRGGLRFVRYRVRSGMASHADGAFDRNEWQRQRQKFRILPYAVPVALTTWLVLTVGWLAASRPS